MYTAIVKTPRNDRLKGEPKTIIVGSYLTMSAAVMARYDYLKDRKKSSILHQKKPIID